jgi:hypothetical protein
MCSLSTARDQSETSDNTADLKYTRKVVDLVEDVKQCTLYLLQKNVFQMSCVPTVASQFDGIANYSFAV